MEQYYKSKSKNKTNLNNAEVDKANSGAVEGCKLGKSDSNDMSKSETIHTLEGEVGSNNVQEDTKQQYYYDQYNMHSTNGQYWGSSVDSNVINEALQNMLMAWYQSGYATGRYQTLCEVGGYHGYGTSDSVSNSNSNFESSQSENK